MHQNQDTTHINAVKAEMLWDTEKSTAAVSFFAGDTEIATISMTKERWQQFADDLRACMQRQAVCNANEEVERYLKELEAKVGEPSPKHIARAQALVDKMNAAVPS